MSNRHERRAAAARERKFEVGTVIRTQIITDLSTGLLYWFEEPQGFDLERDGMPPDAKLHGPFRTEHEVREDERLVLLGPECEVTEGGNWNDAWDRPQ